METTPDPPAAHLGIAAAAAGVGGAATIVMVVVAGGVFSAFFFLLPWLLGCVGLYHAVRAAALPEPRREEAEDRGKRALHFAIFSLSISGMLIVILLFGALMVLRHP